MNVIGEPVTVLEASDPGLIGRSGLVVLETSNTLVLLEGGAKVIVQKKKTAVRLTRTDAVVREEDMSGRLEDRLRSRKR